MKSGVTKNNVVQRKIKCTQNQRKKLKKLDKLG